jgi:hypothetical protein
MKHPRYLIDASEFGYEHIQQGVNPRVVTGVDVSYAIRDIATSPTDGKPCRMNRPEESFGLSVDLVSKLTCPLIITFSSGVLASLFK